MSIRSYLFFVLQASFKRFLPAVLLTLAIVGCGSAGGINLPAPVADLEGGTTREASVCDTVQGAPAGAFVRVRNVSDSAINDVESDLAADGSFSLLVCVKAGETLELEIFDDSGASISGIQNLTRSGTETTTCPAPTNPDPNCP
jgi:hypothetical protein